LRMRNFTRGGEQRATATELESGAYYYIHQVVWEEESLGHIAIATVLSTILTRLR